MRSDLFKQANVLFGSHFPQEFQPANSDEADTDLEEWRDSLGDV